MNETNVIKDFTHSNDVQSVGLDDIIEVGCNHCGSCCINTQVRVNAYDIYQMSKMFDKKSLLDNFTLYFGDDSHLPLVGIFGLESGLCPYLKADLSGDFQCVLEDNKPSMCHHPFVAIATKLDKCDFDFVPFDKEVPKFDIDAYLEQTSVKNSGMYYLKDRSEHCRSNCKSQITVKEYLSPRLKDENERNIANVIPMIYSRYFDVHIMTKILHLAENSKVNNPLDELFGDDKLGNISKDLFLEAYFYTTDPAKDNTSFYDQTVDQINKLEKVILPKYRILYKYLLKVFRTPDEDEFDKIIKENSIDISQKMFDKYFLDHIEDIKDIVVNDMLPNMAHDLEDLLSKLED